MKSIAVLLTCHNRKAKTLACLDALYTCIVPDGYALDVFLVDDSSTDGTGEEVRAQFPTVNVIQGNGNLYWNRGMHLAWKTAAKNEYAYYLWLNDDTILLANALLILFAGLTICDENSIYVGSTKSEVTNELTYGGFLSDNSYVLPNGTWQLCKYFNGNIVLIPKSVFQKVGMNDPSFRHALGDFDYGLRAKKMGMSLLVADKFVGFCEPHESLPKWCNPQTRLIKRIQFLYSPLGNHPIEFFKFDKRHNGIMPAYFHFFTIHLRAVCPQIWVK